MSAPQTDPEKQVRDHRWPVIAMVVIVLVVLAAFLWWLNDETHDPEMPAQVPIEEVTTPADDAPAATDTAPDTAPAPAPAEAPVTD